jgi:phosphonopyruvate decarboxylase
MIDPGHLFATLCTCGVSLYVGIPDSLLKHFCAYVSCHSNRLGYPRHVISANEGSAVALAAGHFLATNKLAVVYMQNSGLGNAMNPLISLSDPAVFGIPMILMIGWRGEPGKADEPQHVLQGQKTIALLETLDIPYTILDAYTDVQVASQKATSIARKRSCPYAFIVRDRAFEPYGPQPVEAPRYPLTREKALKLVLCRLTQAAVVVSTTGMISRELFECREAMGQAHGSDFLMVGSMGHASQIALGIAINRSDREVFCLDGDGAVIMHMGALAVIGATAPRKFRHIILNNSAHDSVGGQPSASIELDFCRIASACGYLYCRVAHTADEIAEAFKNYGTVQGPTLLEIRVKKGARSDLGRPSNSPAENKRLFIEFLQK